MTRRHARGHQASVTVAAAVAAACAGDAAWPALAAPPAPELRADGWEVATWEEAGMDPTPTALLAEEIRAGDLAEEIEALLIIRHGKLVYEEYFDSRYGIDVPHVLNSGTKGVTAMVLGAVVAHGLLSGADVSLADLFPEHEDLFQADPRKRDILLRHVLTMTAGLAWDQKPVSEQDRDDINIIAAEDAARYVLEKPVVAAPGTEFLYSGGCSALLAAAVRNLSGVQADTFAARHLFGPLGIREGDWQWHRMEDGVVRAMGGLSMRGRDVARLGQLYLQRGSWNGQQLVPESWVAASSDPFTTTHERGTEYGFQLWLRALPEAHGGTNTPGDIIFASGFGGNKLYMIPALDLIVVFFGCSGTYDCGLADSAPQVVLYNYILKAIR